MNLNKIIGLTGLYCSGKSTAEKILSHDYGYHIIDVDKIGHLALEKKSREVINHFGPRILSNNIIDRKKLGKIVFRDKPQLKVLNSIVHPFMIEYVQETINRLQSENKKICINAALLFEMGLDKYCHLILIIKSSLFQTLRRAKKRDSHFIWRTLKILSSQKVLKLAKRSKTSADILYIDNNKNIDKLKNKINNVVK